MRYKRESKKEVYPQKLGFGALHNHRQVREAWAVHSAFVGAPSAERRGSLLPRGGSALREGRAPVKRLGLGVSQVDWTTTFDFVVKSTPAPLLRAELNDEGYFLCSSPMAGEASEVCGKILQGMQALPKPKIRNLKPQTPNLKPQTPNPKPQTPNPKSQTPNLNQKIPTFSTP